MPRAVLISIALATAACNAALGLDPVRQRDATAAVDADTLDAPLGPWDDITPLTIAVTVDDEEDPAESPDGDELYFMVQSLTGTTGADLVLSRRDGTTGLWSAPASLTQLNSDTFDAAPRLSADGLTLYLSSDRAGGAGSLDVWASTRPGLAGTWSTPTPVALGGLNTTASDRTLSPCRDGRFVFASDRTSAPSDLFELVEGVAQPIATAGDPAIFEGAPFVTDDCLTVYFAAGPANDLDLFTVTRASLTAPWSLPQRLSVSTIGASDSDPWVSRDGRRLLFSRDVTGTGNFDLYLATR